MHLWRPTRRRVSDASSAGCCEQQDSRFNQIGPLNQFVAHHFLPEHISNQQVKPDCVNYLIMGKKKIDRKKKKAEARLWDGSWDEVMDKRIAHDLTENSDNNLRTLLLQNNRFEADDEYKRIMESAKSKAWIKYEKALELALRLLHFESAMGREFEDGLLVPYGITERGIIPWMKEGNSVIMYKWQYGDPDQSPVKWPESQEVRSLWGKSCLV